MYIICFATHQRGNTREMLRAGIETRLTLLQFIEQPSAISPEMKEFNGYVLFFLCLQIRLNGYRSTQSVGIILHYTGGNQYFLARVLTLPGEYIYENVRK